MLFRSDITATKPIQRGHAQAILNTITGPRHQPNALTRIDHSKRNVKSEVRGICMKQQNIFVFAVVFDKLWSRLLDKDEIVYAKK